MIREAIQELFLGPDASDTATAQYLKVFLGRYFINKVFGTIALGAAWGMYFKLCRTKRTFLGAEDPKYLYMRNRQFVMPETLHALLSEPEVDINHLSNNFFDHGFAPYTYVDRDDYRLGDSEWTYREIEAPSEMSSGPTVSDIVIPHSPEYEYFIKLMAICGRFPKSELHRLFTHYCEILEMLPQESLFEIGDPDEYVYLVIRGSVQVVIVDEKRHVKKLRVAVRGDRIFSLFSFVDVLTGHSKPLKSVEAYALTTSRVVKFFVPAFREYLQLHEERIPDVISRLIRKIYEMNFLMLHRVLGLALLEIANAPTPAFVKSHSMLFTNTDGYEIPADGEVTDQVRRDAIRSFLQYLGIYDETDVLDDCLIFIFDPDRRSREEILTPHPVIDDESIKFKFVFQGKVELYRINSNIHEDSDPDTEPILSHETLYILSPGEGAGGLSTFAEVENFLFTRIVQRSIIVATTQKINQRLFAKFPAAVLPMANQIIKRLSPTIRRMDFGIEWALAKGGTALFVTGNEVRDTFVVLGGRLRSYMIDPKGKLTYYGEYERNDWIGLVESLVRFPVRSKTVIAVRDTEVCKIPLDFITFLKTTFPAAAYSILGYIASRVGKYRFYTRSLKLAPELHLIAGTSRRCASVALVPAAENIPYIPFAKEVKMHHDVYGTSAVISWRSVEEEFNLTVLDYEHEYTVETWIMSVLARFDLVVFVCSNTDVLWTDMCIRHSEVVFTVGLQDEAVGATSVEKRMIKIHVADRKRKELIILHKLDTTGRNSKYTLPRDTIAWLEPRPWLNCHHHLRIPAEAFKYPGLVSNSYIDENYTELQRAIDKHSDMSKFCRWLLGKCVGIVFTGGGARMAVQSGVLKAMVDHDFPIDMVGGVGNGYVIAALYSVYGDMDKVLRYTEEIFRGIRESSKNSFDITIPYISPVQGRQLMPLVLKFFARTRMEDTWTPNFCLTCDISKQDYRVHRDGPFWVYVRASLANFLGAPPINDPKDGGYIVDGSFANPVPEDIMRKFGAEYVLVINTTDGKTFEKTRFDPTKDVWTNLWRLFLLLGSRLNLKTPDFARINEMINRTQKVMYAEAVEAFTDGLFVAFIKPNAEMYPAQQYRDFNRLMHLGHQYAQIILKECPVRGVPFHEFWKNMRLVSAKLERKQGRGIRHNVNEDFWESVDARIFERDEKLAEVRLVELKKKYGTTDEEVVKKAMSQFKYAKEFRDFIFTKLTPLDQADHLLELQEEENENSVVTEAGEG